MQILSSYRDVTAALRNPALAITDSGVISTGAHAAVREAGAEFAHARLDQWQTEMARSAATLVAALPADHAIDLFATFAAPWSLELAAMVTGVTIGEAESLSPLARLVFLAAAHATSPGTESHALDSAIALAGRLPPSSMAVQGFVALCHTLPHFLVSAWDALLSNPAFEQQLRGDSSLIPAGIEELLRFAAPSRAVFRVALAPVEVGAIRIPKGEQVTLLLAAANRDPAQFPDPDRLDLERGAAGHLAFGKGTHACAGAHLIRLAAIIATGALLGSTTSITRGREPEWLDGYAIRAPISLPVILRRQP
jgi:cytochrome P450